MRKSGIKKCGSLSKILAVGLLLGFLALSPLCASSPLQELEEILTNYEAITMSLSNDLSEQQTRLERLETSLGLMSPVIDSLELTWTMRDESIKKLESQVQQMTALSANSQKTIDDLERGLKRTEASLKIWKNVATISIGVGIAGLAVGIINIMIK